MPICLKIGVGLSQVLVMLELAILIRISMRPPSRKFYIGLIKGLRISFLLLTCALIIGWTLICTMTPNTIDESETLDRDALPIAAITFFVLTFALFLSIFLILGCLRAKQKHSNFTQEYAREIKNLLIILFIFSFSFLTRCVADTWVVPLIITGNDELCKDSDGRRIICYAYAHSLWLITTQYIFDVIPIGAILLFHHFNFKTQSIEVYSQVDGQSTQDLMSDSNKSERKCVLDLDSNAFMSSSVHSSAQLPDADVRIR